ncbi:MAG: formate dehydrogenase accessory sulfurtransferase FdhD [Chloroflexota bacterium]|nr:formate dehydrogenase accessory sulfurtransferase FdhD [Chloroflexota bacterium]
MIDQEGIPAHVSLDVTDAEESGGAMSISTCTIARWDGSKLTAAPDVLASEEPLQIRFAGLDVAVTMRTPGHDAELASGFLFTEGIITGLHHIRALGHCSGPSGELESNIFNIHTAERSLVDPSRWSRSFVALSSCGICGKKRIEDIARVSAAPDVSLVSAAVLTGLEAAVQQVQEGFAATGGLHAAALFALDGSLLVHREDVGRHNAVDKVIGYALLNGMLPLSRHILFVSSRASFEIIQKARMAGIGAVAVLSAPTSLAVALAEESGMLLVAFLRKGRFNVYSGVERIRPAGGSSSDASDNPEALQP